ncbi:hypothetical protein CORT_0C07050 [Candida orthopsilosis Co 90-125]|uniref:Uncharacterized protein n=1 Tax=Candida orthopsilosis (strain 90-125) TaxID=1136231 RepID=H8X4C4_CANO9|nr:hypothetical protein CORT_0C07050 [Candida orthopsilosis Co 90-125]CCG26076.1 hypothetical protein CORT_0C07050 [Candida orthopsilosis Co 90-125]
MSTSQKSKKTEEYTFLSPQWFYNMYYVHFPFIMLTRAERLLLHGSLLLFIFLIVYGAYSYLFYGLMKGLSQMYYYTFGDVQV